MRENEGSEGEEMTESRTLKLMIQESKYKKQQKNFPSSLESERGKRLEEDIERANISEIPHIPHNKI